MDNELAVHLRQVVSALGEAKQAAVACQDFDWAMWCRNEAAGIKAALKRYDQLEPPAPSPTPAERGEP